MRKLQTDELNRLSADQFKNTKKNPVVIVLDNVRSMHNVGSVFRTGDAFLVEKVVLTGITGQPPHRDIHKTALGAEETVAWEHHPSAAAAVENLKKSGYQIIVLEHTSQRVSLETFRPREDGQYAFVFGNEVFGVSDEVLPLADKTYEIPQFGTKHSLNISVSVGVVLWDYLLKK